MCGEDFVGGSDLYHSLVALRILLDLGRVDRANFCLNLVGFLTVQVAV